MRFKKCQYECDSAGGDWSESTSAGAGGVTTSASCTFQIETEAEYEAAMKYMEWLESLEEEDSDED